MIHANFSAAKLLSRCAIFSVLLLLAVLAALKLGAQPISLKRAWLDITSVDHDILFDLRLPRVLLAAIVGVSLSVGGVSFQCLLRNPLADPFILGVSGGAALGSVLALILRLSLPLMSTMSFAAALSSMLFIYWLAQSKRTLPVYSLLLTGVIFNSFTFSLIMLINSLVSFDQAHRIWYLMVGGLGSESYAHIGIVAIFVAIGFALIMLQSGNMNLLMLGEEFAHHLGLSHHRLRAYLFFAASLMIGATVSVSGLIGFVGLFVPHWLRLMFGPDHRYLVPLSALFGASFLVLADMLARSLLTQSAYNTELPVGVITALLGGPFFVYLLKRGQR